ncbi:MAG: ATP-binding protein [Lachnospiraceae bacterium]|nr:ATP-binding protein [Lachnospiraceae bacterium]
MKNKKKTTGKRLRLWPLEALLGIFLIGGVFLIATNADMRETEQRLCATVSYIKEQCNQYNRMNLASETKSLMRIIESAHQIERQLTPGQELKESLPIDEEAMEACVRSSYVTGALLLDLNGNVQAEYCDKFERPEELEAYFDTETLLDTAKVSEKSYSVRIACADGSYVDLGAVGRSDGSGVVAAYYQTSAEYVNTFSLTLEALLTGYSLEDDGTIVVSSGNDIVASNDTSLIGQSTDDIPILRRIKAEANSDRLVHAKRNANSQAQNFGLMEHGRDYYVYAFMPEQAVFNSTFQNVFYSLIVYLVLLAVINIIRWRMAEGYQENQLAAQKMYAENLRSKNEQLREAVDQADRANAAKTSFLSRMSHDIRTPLNGIIGLLEIDEAHPDDLALIRANQKKMKIAANHLLSLINDILQMSKLESGRVELTEEPMDLQELSAGILAIIEQRAAEAGITLEYDKNSGRIAYSNVYGSPLYFRQIFLNIYSNCIKYNKVGGKVETSCTCLGIKDGVVTYRWSIRDTGIGMKPEFVKHIFDPFAQERSDARSVYNGTGLGMAIVKNLIDKMNGTIEVTSEENVGSIFVITLPLRLVEEANLPVKEPREQTKEAEESGEIGGLHLLLAEDNDLNAEIAETLLTDRGAVITIAHDGQQALDAFEANPPGTFDAILMDVMMPVIDGLSATRMIRALPREDAKKIPIIAMTANAFDEDVKRCMEAGMDAHLSKPLQMEQVGRTIAKYCRNRGERT